MKFGLKVVLFLFVASVAFRIAMGLTEVEMPGWVAWVGLVIWLPIIAWFLIKLPGWRRKHKQQQASSIRTFIETDRPVTYIDQGDRA
jgi:hypothetical protein